MELRNYELTDNSSKVAELRTHEITEQWTIKRNTTRLKQLENGIMRLQGIRGRFFDPF